MVTILAEQSGRGIDGDAGDQRLQFDRDVLAAGTPTSCRPRASAPLGISSPIPSIWK